VPLIEDFDRTDLHYVIASPGGDLRLVVMKLAHSQAAGASRRVDIVVGAWCAPCIHVYNVIIFALN
jgi:hypothetical protein